MVLFIARRANSNVLPRRPEGHDPEQWARVLTRPYQREQRDLDELERLVADLAAAGDSQLLIGRIEQADKILQQWIAAAPQADPAEILDNRYAWVEALAAALISGWPLVEVETFSPYAADYQQIPRELSELHPSDQTGVFLWSFFRQLADIFPSVYSVMLIDDYNYVAPERGQEFLLAITQILQDNDALRQEDQPGRDFVILRESDLAQRSEAIVDRLQGAARGQLVSKDGDLFFRPSPELVESLNLASKSRRQGLLKKGVRLKQGSVPSCSLMDCASYQPEVNEMIIHWNLLPEKLAEQQDRTYALLRALDLVPQEAYHNTFFSDQASTAEILSALAQLMSAALNYNAEITASIDSWQGFEPQEYVQRNYGQSILPEDRHLISAAIDYLQENIPENSLSAVVDVGAGPNLYPGLLWLPFVAEDGQLTLQEYVSANRQFLRQQIAAPEAIWGKFAQLMAAENQVYQGVLDKIRATTIEYRSVLDLPPGEFAGLSAFFVCESITHSRIKVQNMIGRLLAALRPGGHFLIAHMLGSASYHAGAGTKFPATALSADDLRVIYSNYSQITFNIVTPEHPDQEVVRDGYQGMALVQGQVHDVGENDQRG